MNSLKLKRVWIEYQDAYNETYLSPVPESSSLSSDDINELIKKGRKMIKGERGSNLCGYSSTNSMEMAYKFKKGFALKNKPSLEKNGGIHG